MRPLFPEFGDDTKLVAMEFDRLAEEAKRAKDTKPYYVREALKNRKTSRRNNTPQFRVRQGR